MLLSLLSAVLFLVSFPITRVDASPWPLIFVAVVPFFISLDKEERPLRRFLAGCLWGAVMSIGMAYWLVCAMIWEYGVSVFITILFMIFGLMLPHGLIYGVFAVLYRFIKDNALSVEKSALFHVLCVPSLWIIIDYSRELIPLLVPWGFAGYAIQPWNLYAQAADLSGINGVSFLIIMINSILAGLYAGSGLTNLNPARVVNVTGEKIGAFMKKNRLAVAVLILAMILPPAYGYVRRSVVRLSVSQEAASGKTLNAEVVQPNFTQRERWSEDGFMQRVNTCVMMMDRQTCPEPVGSAQDKLRRQAQGDILRQAQDDALKGIVVWPETVLNSEAMIDAKLFSFLRSWLCPSRFLVAGGLRRDINKTGAYNAAYIVSGGGGTAFYDKNILLPYSETAPFGDFLGSFYSAPTEFLRGETPSAAQTDGGVIGLSICFEAMYPSYVRDSVRRGAQLLVNISNDGWFGMTSEPVMHLRQASIRAIENRRYLIRSSNNGISAIIDPAGELVRRSGLFTRERINGTIIMMDGASPYALIGDWIVYFSAMMMLGFFIAIMIKR